MQRIRAEAAVLIRLSPRERQVVRLLANGLLNKQIAHHLRIAERTVKGHIEKLAAELRMNRIQLATFRRKNDGLTSFF